MRRLILVILAGWVAGCASRERVLLEPAAFAAVMETQQVLVIEDARGTEAMLMLLAVGPASTIVSLTTPLGLPRLVVELRDDALQVRVPGRNLPLGARALLADLQFAWWPEAAVQAAYGASPWSLDIEPGRRALSRKGQPEMTVSYRGGSAAGGFTLEDHRRGVRLIAADPGQSAP